MEGKRQARILIGIEIAEDAGIVPRKAYPRTGKMVVECQDHAGAPVKWTFYLEEECVVGTHASSEKSSRISVSTSKSGRSSKSMRSSTSTKSSKSPKSSSQS